MQRNCGHSVPECRLNRVAFRQTPSHPSEEAVKNWCFFAELKAEDVTWQVEATDLTPAIAEISLSPRRALGHVVHTFGTFGLAWRD